MKLVKSMVKPLLDVVPVGEFPVDPVWGTKAKISTTKRIEKSKYAKLISSMTDEELQVLIMTLSLPNVIEAIKYKDRSCNDKYGLQPEALRRELMRRASIMKIAND